uniref:Uncharacterized protein n=1 Tax=Rhizophora mucronata TaxID=61149 RepID=A0A2P2Q1L0_RHIMU
MLYIRKNKKF